MRLLIQAGVFCCDQVGEGDDGSDTESKSNEGPSDQLAARLGSAGSIKSMARGQHRRRAIDDVLEEQCAESSLPPPAKAPVRRVRYCSGKAAPPIGDLSSWGVPSPLDV